ncbi:MAG: cytochrome c oxidase assembly protein [Chloroflexi bacterium]|nr:cytochrome c oxidase assembly protein [Chloroflexota bacterium]
MNELAGSLWTHWHAHPDVLIGLALLLGAYLFGVGPLRERYNLADGVEPRQVATFTAGVLVIFVALLSPIHFLSDGYLFSVHMVQHVLITLVAPPLLILGTPDWLIRPLLRPNWSFRLARILTNPIFAIASFNLVFSLWHVPALYDASVTIRGLHIAEHLIMITTATLMWWPLTSNMPELPRLSYPIQMGYLFILSMAQIIVFAIITFASHPLYDFYASAPRIFGIGPLLDQQIGAIIMKIGGGTLFLGLFVMAFFRWYNQEQGQADAERAEREYLDGFPDFQKPPLEDNYR